MPEVNILNLLFLFFLLACSQKKNQVTLIKQWHLTPQTNTQNIEKAKTIPQYENQLDIYARLSKQIENGEVELIIAEGCEGEMTNTFEESFNGWSLSELKSRVGSPEYADILAPVPMKLKAKYPHLKIICGDDKVLVEENLKAASDMRGFFAFFQKLQQLKKDKDIKQFDFYVSKLAEIHPDKFETGNAIEFSKNGVLTALEDFERLIIKRNNKFQKIIMENIEKNPVVIIGGLHVTNLSEQLKKMKIPVKIVTPAGYKDDEAQLVKKFKEYFHLLGRKWTGFMLPENFELKKFEFKNLIDEKKIAMPEEVEELKKLLIKAELDPRIFVSDFDGDGIRDFTIATKGEDIILSAEDMDWDNDGKLNLIDESLGEIKIASLSQKISLANNYLSQTGIKNVVDSLKQKFKIVQQTGQHHEFLVLEVLDQLIKKLSLPVKDLKVIRAASLDISKGENNFFNYVIPEKTLNYDAKKLHLYVQTQFKKNFKGADYKKYINSFVVPLIIHSLAHEFGHSLNYDFDEIAESMGWKIKREPVKSQYLKKFREPLKIRNTFLSSAQFRGKSHQTWLKEASTSKGQLFLETHNLLSLYSTLNPSEWFAELYSICKFRKVYANSAQKEESRRWIQLLGINPKASPGEVCLSF